MKYFYFFFFSSRRQRRNRRTSATYARDRVYNETRALKNITLVVPRRRKKREPGSNLSRVDVGGGGATSCEDKRVTAVSSHLYMGMMRKSLSRPSILLRSVNRSQWKLNYYTRRIRRSAGIICVSWPVWYGRDVRLSLSLSHAITTIVYYSKTQFKKSIIHINTRTVSVARCYFL